MLLWVVLNYVHMKTWCAVSSIQNDLDSPKNERDSVDLHAMTCTVTKMCKWNDGKKINGYIV